MYMKKRKINNKLYWSLVKSYRENGKVKQKIVKNLGITDKAIEILESDVKYKKYLEQLKIIINQDKEKAPIIKKKNKKNGNLKELCFKLTKAKFKYIAVRRKCVEETIKISYKSLETIVEMALDYSIILREKAEQLQDGKAYQKAVYRNKVDEIEKIGSDIATVIQYSKKCSISKPPLDVGMDAFTIMANRKKH